MSQRGDSDKKSAKGRGRPRSSSNSNKDGKKVKSEKKAGDVKGKKKDFGSFGVFINRLLKNVHSDVGITKNGMKVMDSFVKDLIDRIGNEAGSLCKYQKMQTLGTFHIVGAIKLVLPPEIAQHAIEEGKRAHDALEAPAKSTHN